MSITIARALSRFVLAVLFALLVGRIIGTQASGFVAGCFALLVIDRVQLLRAWSYKRSNR